MTTERFTSFARLRQIRSIDEVRLAEVLAKVDDHNVIAPTHLVVKNGSPVGHFSINNIPLWIGHLGKTLVTPHDTFRLIHIVEGLLESRGASATLTLVGKESGLHPKMVELGYRCTGNADVFLKEF